MVILIVAAFLRLKCTTGAAGRPKHSAKHVFFRLDPAASILLIASVCCLLVAMQRGGQHLSWTSPKIIGLFTVSGILFALFLGLEWRTGDDASVPFNILRRRSIAFGAVYLFLFSMPNFSVRELINHTSTRLTVVVRYLYTSILPSSEGIQCAEKRC